MKESQRSKKPKEENLSSFLQSEEYQVLRANLQSELNHNSEMFNIELPFGKKLIKKTNVISKYDFSKTKSEKEICKIEKSKYKLAHPTNR